MKLMAIVGSPRKGGNTDILVDKVIEGAKSKKEVDATKIYIVDKKINYCTGCGGHLGGKKCTQKDDMDEILSEMQKCDAFVFGTPNHMRVASAPMVNFLTRMIPLLAMKPVFDENKNIIDAEVNSKVEGKRVGAVISQGDPMASSSALVLQILANNFADLRMKFVGDVLSVSNLKKGEVAGKREELSRAFALGVRLAR